MSGKIDLTVGEIQGNLRQILEDQNMDLTAEQRYSLMAAIETMDFLRRLSPGLKKGLQEYRNARLHSAGARPTSKPAKANRRGVNVLPKGEVE